MSGSVKVNHISLGDSSTATNNFVLKTNVDGTGGLYRGNAGAELQSIVTWDAPGKVVFPQNAQTWQDVTGSRAHSTDYTNSTGQPIKVSVYCNTGGSSGSVSIRVAGLDIAVKGFNVADNFSQLYAEVPAGAVYRLYNYGGANPANITWMELR